MGGGFDATCMYVASACCFNCLLLLVMVEEQSLTRWDLLLLHVLCGMVNSKSSLYISTGQSYVRIQLVLGVLVEVFVWFCAWDCFYCGERR